MAGRSTATSGNNGWQVVVYKNGELASRGLIRTRRAEADEEWTRLAGWLGQDNSAEWEVVIVELVK